MTLRVGFLGRLFLTFLAVSLTSLGMILAYSSHVVRTNDIEELTLALLSRNRLVAERVAPLMESPNVAALDQLVKQLGQEAGVRITLMRPDGTVTADSEGDPARMDNHLDRPEVAQALSSGVGRVVRPSRTLDKDMVYTALPLWHGGRRVGVARLALPLDSVDHIVRQITMGVGGAALGVVLAAALLSLWASRRILAPLEEIRHGAQRLAQGEKAILLEHSRWPPEFIQLAASLNRMAHDLAERLRQVERLETIRRDFVANVSHELKTPIHAIRGGVEALADGDLPENAGRFLDILHRQSQRLETIVDDLLFLSRLEAEEEKRLALETVRIAELLEFAMADCRLRAQAKHIQLELDCPAELTAVLNPHLVEQAMVNLIDNAVKYSGEHTQVTVGGAKAPGGLALWVADQGPGISPEHLERLFERFYRVDKARSRQMGGTGLGLAIVKHIAQAHGGSAAVESRVNEGSTFTIRLPGRVLGQG
ncbi:MAG: ATP-binding protein [Deltaproteobacteria bacterium]|nr:ATP-binding protein [Deltaproteobacteria bacterium]